MKLPLPPMRISSLRPLNHQALSFGALAALSLATLAATQIFGDPSAARPKRIVSLNAAAGAPAFRAPLSDVVLDPAHAGDADPQLGFGFDFADEADPSSIEAGLYAPRPSPLPKAPYAKLTAPGPKGPLPIIAADGSMARTAYKRPFTSNTTKPRIGVIVGGLGFNAAVTLSAIEELPPEVTLSFIPYTDNLQTWIDRARAAGHEVLIELPMEPFDPDANDTGPQTLTANGSAKENIAKLENLLSRAGGYFGVSNYQGAKFAMSGAAAAPVVKALKDRGLAFISNGVGRRAPLGAEAGKVGLPFTAADRVLDAQRDADAINDQLLDLETIAQQGGAALGAGFAFPVTVTQIRSWADSLNERGFVLAPASAIVESRSQQR